VYGTVQHSTVLYSTHIIEIQKLTTDNTTKAGINYKEGISMWMGSHEIDELYYKQQHF